MSARRALVHKKIKGSWNIKCRSCDDQIMPIVISDTWSAGSGKQTWKWTWKQTWKGHSHGLTIVTSPKQTWEGTSCHLALSPLSPHQNRHGKVLLAIWHSHHCLLTKTDMGRYFLPFGTLTIVSSPKQTWEGTSCHLVLSPLSSHQKGETLRRGACCPN